MRKTANDWDAAGRCHAAAVQQLEPRRRGSWACDIDSAMCVGVLSVKMMADREAACPSTSC